MRLFSPDLLRPFSLGFLLGALLVAGAYAQGWGKPPSPPARAADLPETIRPTAEFVIAPAERGR
jgi:hypothetical protein